MRRDSPRYGNFPKRRKSRERPWNRASPAFGKLWEHVGKYRVDLIVNMNENSSKIKVKGGEGYGMFDKATRIEIIFNDNEYIVSNPDEIEQIIRLCRQNWEPSNTHITKEDCDMCVKFIGTDTEVWVDTETLSSYIGESFVQMPEDLFKKIKEVVSLSNTPRPGKFVYKLMFLKFSRLIF